MTGRFLRHSCANPGSASGAGTGILVCRGEGPSPSVWATAGRPYSIRIKVQPRLKTSSWLRRVITPSGALDAMCASQIGQIVLACVIIGTGLKRRDGSVLRSFHNRRNPDCPQAGGRLVRLIPYQHGRFCC